MSQGRRNQVLRDFAKAKTQILVATDIAARGIDIEGITHVFNFDVPHDVDYYIHRIGRTGRAGSESLSIMFATAADENWVRRIEHNIHATITKYTLTGQVKVKASSRPPKKKKTYKDKLPASTYQTTKEKRHKQPIPSRRNSRPRPSSNSLAKASRVRIRRARPTRKKRRSPTCRPSAIPRPIGKMNGAIPTPRATRSASSIMAATRSSSRTAGPLQ